MVKEKPNSTRIYDKDGFRRRAACICVKSDSETEVLLVSSSRRPELWIVPGGGVEPNEESFQTAVREVLEEAGVTGSLERCLGLFENLEHKHRTEVYVMKVTQELDEWEDSKIIGRQRKWFLIEDALNQLSLHKPTQRQYLQQLKNKNKILVEGVVVARQQPTSDEEQDQNNKVDGNDDDEEQQQQQYSTQQSPPVSTQLS